MGAAFFQAWRRPSPTPSRRAASATESFCSVIIATARSLNSGVYALRARAIGVSPLIQSLHRSPAVHDRWGTSHLLLNGEAFWLLEGRLNPGLGGTPRRIDLLLPECVFTKDDADGELTGMRSRC